MQLTYIFHSGFALETDRCILVFDYWTDPADVASRFLQSDKPLYVLSSHFHEDHFNRVIFSWKEKRKDVHYILSKDILKHRRAQKEEADAWLAKGATWNDGRIRVTATGSTDSGVSWVVETDGKRIFHAGDLNNWYARFLTDDYAGGPVYSPEFGTDIHPEKEEKLFLGELKDIRKVTDRFDIVMFPIDGRIGNGYTRGGRQFIERFQTGLFVPMHFTASGFESAARMKEFTDPRGISFWSISREGESITY
ncbi:MBL fold metallo-hydrolase [uncultured Phocaeicola sp.]|uniref:MBL fold metallo-hydrolase n=1 Tax=uncultured Phocaeicola sp. TaxID=990718 RepID=UPI0025ED0763|nr:MBL fold metallo-hydrolase [uncultured Phocaeicola sp.]